MLGLILVPLARPAMAVPMDMPASDHVMVDQDMADHETTAMPEGMPCCPDQSRCRTAASTA